MKGSVKLIEFAEVCIHHLANRELKYTTSLSHGRKKWHTKCTFPVSRPRLEKVTCSSSLMLNYAKGHYRFTNETERKHEEIFFFFLLNYFLAQMVDTRFVG